MKNSFLLIVIASLILLASCVPGEPQKSDDGTNAEPSVTPLLVTTAESEESNHCIRYELGELASVFTNMPENAKIGECVEIRTGVLHDADIHLFLGEQELEKTHGDSDYWGYTFVMPDQDVVITAKPYSKNETLGMSDEPLNILQNVQYIRTDGYIDGEQYPKAFWITSTKELKDYCEINKDKYYLESNGFMDATKQYDDTYFENNDLIVVMLEEGSGSIGHEVTGLIVTPLQNNGKQYEVQPEIKRIIPECGTDDMAEWHILIEIGKEYGESVSELQLPSIVNVYGWEPSE